MPLNWLTIKFATKYRPIGLTKFYYRKITDKVDTTMIKLALQYFITNRDGYNIQRITFFGGPG